MDQSQVEQLLYSFFVANEGSEITYRRIKNVTDSIVGITGPSKNSLSALFMLLRNGSVEHVTLSKYRLSPSCLIQIGDFQLGINLTRKHLDCLASQLIELRGGLSIYYSSRHPLGIPVRSFNLKEVLSKCSSIYNNSQNLLSVASERPRFVALKRYDALLKKFVEQKDFVNEANLYRVYSFSHSHFQYYYENTIVNIGTFPCIHFERHDFEMLNLYKAVLSLAGQAEGLVYRSELQVLEIDNYYPMPSTIERILYLHSILKTGKFPIGRQYHLGERDFHYLQETFNHKIIRNNEERI